MRLNIKSILTKYWYVLFIILIAAFLRLYRLPEFTMFLSDQGRDAIIMKRIMTGEHFPAIGAPSSIGQIYLGPFYYYLIAPFLMLFNFNPAGMSYGVAFLSILGLIISYIIIYKEINKLAAFFFVFLTAFSFINIESSRFSWNPNLLPIFSFLTLYFLYKTLHINKYQWAFLFGAFFSFSFQLHHLATLLFLPIFIVVCYDFWKAKNNRNLFIKLFNYLIAFFSFIFFSLPLVIFDLRHNLLNLNNLFKLYKERNPTDHEDFLPKLLETNRAFFSHLLQYDLNRLTAFIIFILIVSVFIYIAKRASFKNYSLIMINFVALIAYLLFFTGFNTVRLPHYYGPIYFSLLLIISVLMAEIIKKYKKTELILIGISLILYVVVQSRSYYFLFKKGSNQISHSQKVADFLAAKIDNKPFNIATWPVELTEDNYLYFLELKGLVPADRTKVEITNQMFVLCNRKPCKILGSPSWNISMFGLAKIDKIWNMEGIEIYKLVHIK